MSKMAASAIKLAWLSAHHVSLQTTCGAHDLVARNFVPRRRRRGAFIAAGRSIFFIYSIIAAPAAGNGEPKADSVAPLIFMANSELNYVKQQANHHVLTSIAVSGAWPKLDFGRIHRQMAIITAGIEAMRI